MVIEPGIRMWTDEEMWRAVAERDAAGAGVFVFAVKTTGVFCRPGCASRRPRRENVVFFDGPDAARAEGFRPCQRCRPEAPPGESAAARLVEEAERLMGSEPDGLGAGRAAERLGVSRTTLHRAFVAVRGSAAGGRARTGRVPIATWGTLRTDLAWAAVAFTPGGVGAIDLGATEAEARERLLARLAGAELREDSCGLAQQLERVRGAIDGAGEPPELDPAGTEFQIAVWRRLRTIPCGQTRTYLELAREMGREGSVRAVAGACGANPIAVLIPCHRVIARSGGLSGFRWGTALKAELLRREGVRI